MIFADFVFAFFRIAIASYRRVPSTPYRWHVVTNFLDWQFPKVIHEVFTRCAGFQDALSNTAAQSNLTAAIHQRDITCRVTAFESGTEVAHLIPEHEKQ